MTDPSKNAFQNSMSLYMGGTNGTTLGSGMTGSALQSTTSDGFVVNYEGVGSPLSLEAGTSCGLEIRASPAQNATFLDFHSTPGYFKSYDYRMQSTGGDNETIGQATMIMLGAETDIRTPTRVETLRTGGSVGKAFKVDYDTTPAATGTNQITTITFTAGLFTVAPTVVCTANTPTASTGEQITHVEEVTADGFKVEYLGTAAAGTFINWIAIGI